MRRSLLGLLTAVLAALSWVGPTHAQDELPTPAGLIDSGVTSPTPEIVPNPADGPSLAPAAVPGDPEASMALRRDLASKLRMARREPTVPVPPVLEIEVLDPNADPLGNPAVVPVVDAAGRTHIDIPPVVLVHRYYYTGDRSFQGPMLPGGPSILVMSHPKTNERLYVEVQMLPGAPRVTYSRWSIEFDYGPQAITLKFGHHGKPKVEYRQGIAFFDRIRLAREARRERVEDWSRRAGLTEAGEQFREASNNAVDATADGVRVVGRMVATPFLQIIQRTPLGAPFQSDPAREAEVQRAAFTREAESAARRFGGDVPTNR